jgi:hypothetical protein
VTQPIILWRLRWGEIERVECTKVTAYYVWPVAANRFGALKEARQSDWNSYHETWADAHQVLLAKADLKLAYCRRELEKAQGDYGRIKGMKPPADAEVQP